MALDLLLCPITAVAYSPVESTAALLFVAQGPTLRVYERTHLVPHFFSHVFETQSIHGISVKFSLGRDAHPDWIRCVIWGGRSIRILDARFRSSPAANDIHFTFLANELLIDDRILHSVLSPFSVLNEEGDAQRQLPLACLITAHNELRVLVTTPDNEGHLAASVHNVSGSPISLYSAFCLWETEQVITVTAGTVSGNVHMWRTTFDVQHAASNLNATSVSSVTFRGHEGSVYGVGASLGFRKPGSAIVVSCSDDRTVRAWQAEGRLDGNLEFCEKKSRNPTDEPTNSTGFKSQTTQAFGTGEFTSHPVSHLSRIWSVLPFTLPTSGAMVLSAGEDGAVHIWAAETQEKAIIMADEIPLSPVTSFRRHTGKHAWSVDVQIQQDAALGDKVHIITGGADGRVIDQCLRLGFEKKPSTKRDLDWNEDRMGSNIFDTFVSGHLLTQGVSNSGDKIFGAYAFIDNDQILACSRFGHIFFGLVLMPHSVSTESKVSSTHLRPVDWKVCRCVPELHAPIIISRVPKYGALLLGKFGHLFAWKIDSSAPVNLTKLKSSASTILPLENYACSTCTYAAVIVYHAGTEAHILTWNHGDSEDPQCELTSLEIPKGFRPTAATWMHGDETIVLGSRNGKLLFYNRNNVSASGQVKPHFATPQMHGNNAITQLLNLKTFSPLNGAPAFLLSTGRDGRLLVCSVTKSMNNEINFQKVHQIKLPLGPDVEGAYQHPFSRDIFVWGFRSTDFILWNYTTQMEAIKVPCGGGHRNWDFMPDPATSGGGRLMWTRASSTLVYVQDSASHSIVQSGSHGREIKAIAVRSNEASSDAPFIATGSEDTTIRIAEYCDKSDQKSKEAAYIHTHCIVPHHTAGIHQLQWSKDGNYLFSSGGAEQLLVWRVQAVPSVSIGIVLLAECPRVSADGDLRVTDLSVHQVEEDGNSTTYLIAASYSDSTLRLWSFDSLRTATKFRLIAAGTYGSNCLTQVQYISFAPGSVFLTASTDGHLAIWANPSERIFKEPSSGNIPLSLNILFTHNVHQSSIKSMKATRLTSCPCAVLVATGGDDNAIALTTMSHHVNTPVLRTVLVPKAHAAAVTGLVWLREKASGSSTQVTLGELHQTERHVLISASGDQTLRGWEIHVGVKDTVSEPSIREVLSVRKMKKWSSSIADISSMSLMLHGERRKLVVAGVGVEVWDADTLIHG